MALRRETYTAALTGEQVNTIIELIHYRTAHLDWKLEQPHYDLEQVKTEYRNLMELETLLSTLPLDH